MKVIIFILVYMLIGAITNLIWTYIEDRLDSQDDLTYWIHKYLNIPEDEAVKVIDVTKMLSLYVWPIVWAVILYCSIYWFLNKD